MGAFFIYILKSSVCLVLFYLFFRVLLSKETFHRFNRVALLGVLFLSLLIPFIEVTTNHQVEVQQTMLTIEQVLLMAEMLPRASARLCSQARPYQRPCAERNHRIRLGGSRQPDRRTGLFLRYFQGIRA